jgi:hypothetical protein
VFDPHRFYSAPEVWAESGAPRELVYGALARGELRGIRRGRRWLIPGVAAIAWLEEVRPMGNTPQTNQAPVRVAESSA